MPAKSEAQRRFAGMSMTPEGRAKLRASGKAPMPKDAARDFAKKSVHERYDRAMRKQRERGTP